MGKTAFVLNVVDYVSVRKNLPCTQLLGVYIGLHGKHTVYQLFL